MKISTLQRDCEKVYLQIFFQKLTGVRNAVRAVTEGLSGPDAFEQPALGGTVALLELFHHFLHAGAGLDAIFRFQAHNHSGAHKGTASAFHIAHPGSVGPGNVKGGLLVQANQVTIRADYGLGAVMRVAALFFRCKVFAVNHYCFQS